MRRLLPVLVILCAGCGSEAEAERPATGPEPAAPVAVAQPAVPAPATAPAATAAPAAAPPVPVAPAMPVVIDLAAPQALAMIKPSGQPDAGLRLVGEGASRSLAFTAAGGRDWPGIAIQPAVGAWDLSAAGAVEASLENVGGTPAMVGLRVDQQGGGADAWNGENLRLAPGATGTLRVTFGQSWGTAGFKLDPARIGRIQLYLVKPAEDCLLQLHSLRAAAREAAKQAGPPKAIVVVHRAADPRILGFAAGIDGKRVRASGAALAPGDGGAAITLSAPTAEVVFRPAQPLDLRDYHQATFTLRNPGAAPVRVRCRLDDAAVDAVVPAGGRAEVVVPFAAAAPWRGVTPGARPAAPGDKPFLGAPEERSSAGLVSDAVGTVALAIDGATGSSLVWEGVTAATGGAAVIPAWVGTRPPVAGEWEQVLDEEFAGEALDTTRWTPRLPWIGPIPWELQCYSDRNVSVGDGCLRIRCEKRTAHLYENPAWPERDYATGAVTTYPHWRWRYGYAEARMKLPKALGLWPAFWTMPDRGPLPDAVAPAGGDWQAQWDAARSTPDKNRRRSTDVDGMEFDIFEHPNRFGPFRYNVACHWDGYGAQHKSTGSSRIYSQPDAEGYVIAGLLWEEGRATWYCNGQEVGTWADPRVASVPMSLKFTVQMGGWAGNEVDDSALPDEFAVDWVRVWQRRK